MSAEMLKQFGLVSAPFSTSPDPRYAYATVEHNYAMNKVLYHVDERQGLFLLRGSIGTGKTTIAQLLINHWSQNENMVVAYLTNASDRRPAAFVRAVLDAFGTDSHRNFRRCWDLLQAFLIDNSLAGRTVVLVIDQAHTISSDNLSTVNDIADLQTQTHKLIQIVLVAETSIDSRLAFKPALCDRIAASSTLNPLAFSDVVAMLRFRVAVAKGLSEADIERGEQEEAVFGDKIDKGEKTGGLRYFDEIFPGEIVRRMYNVTQGIPRRLCVLCANSLFIAYMRGATAVNESDVARALDELSFKKWGELEEGS